MLSLKNSASPPSHKPDLLKCTQALNSEIIQGRMKDFLLNNAKLYEMLHAQAAA